MKVKKRKISNNKRKKKINESKIKSEISINKNINISTLLEKYPELNEFFLSKGLFCFGCSIASIETLGMLCDSYGIDWQEFRKEIEDFLKKKHR